MRIKKSCKIEPPLASDPRVVTSVYYYNFVSFVSNAKCVFYPRSKKNRKTAVNIVLHLLLSHFYIYFSL